MPTYRNISGVWKNVVPWRNIAGTWKSGTLWRNIGGVWKQVAGELTASASPSSVSGVAPGPGVVTSNSTTATPTGGVGPYTYEWANTGGDASATAGSPTSDTTNFSSTVGAGNVEISYWVCTITDTSTGQVAATNTVTCTLEGT